MVRVIKRKHRNKKKGIISISPSSLLFPKRRPQGDIQIWIKMRVKLFREGVFIVHGGAAVPRPWCL